MFNSNLVPEGAKGKETSRNILVLGNEDSL